MDLDAIEQALREGMQAAAEKPGRYGGRYVARYYDCHKQVDCYCVLTDDDPEALTKEEIKLGIQLDSLDVLAHCFPQKTSPVGRARYWIRENGTINREYFGDR